MSFPSINGADCSSGQNPMVQMMKQLNQDRSLQKDHFVGSSANNTVSMSMRTREQRLGVFNEDNMVNDFFGQEQQHRLTQQPGNVFEFSRLEQELDAVQHNQPSSWAGDFHQQQYHQRNIPPLPLGNEETATMERAFLSTKSAMKAPTGWHEEFMNHSEQSRLDPIQPTVFNNNNNFQNHVGWSNGMSVQSPPFYYQQQNTSDSNRIVELDQQGWEDQFAAFDSDQVQEEQQQRNDQQEEETEEEMAKRIEEAASKDPAAFKEFESIWQDLRDQMAKEESDVDEGDDWEDEFGHFGPSSGGMYKPDLGDYVFEIENPYLDHTNPLAEAQEMMANQSNGTIISLSELALALEAAVQKDPTDSDVWMHLGNVQAQNEKEEPAIRALEKAVSVNASNYRALMSLAVSYTNESYDHAAYKTLQQWISEKYPSVVNEPLLETATPYELHERVTAMFIKAAQMAPDGQAMDPDVQVGLGVLFYGGGDLEKAIDCFYAAVKGRPDDYLLWNRLGATLANNGRSEDAIEAYHKALELCPSFVRARYNLGVSCLNIGCYKEAAEHLLTGLSMHKRGITNNEEGINVSRNLWDMLRKSLNMLDRRDLAEKAVPGADINQFRVDFEF